jgi:hypothetical protein
MKEYVVLKTIVFIFKSDVDSDERKKEKIKEVSSGFIDFSKDDNTRRSIQGNVLILRLVNKLEKIHGWRVEGQVGGSIAFHDENDELLKMHLQNIRDSQEHLLWQKKLRSKRKT